MNVTDSLVPLDIDIFRLRVSYMLVFLWLAVLLFQDVNFRVFIIKYEAECTSTLTEPYLSLSSERAGDDRVYRHQVTDTTAAASLVTCVGCFKGTT